MRYAVGLILTCTKCQKLLCTGGYNSRGGQRESWQKQYNNYYNTLLMQLAIAGSIHDTYHDVIPQ